MSTQSLFTFILLASDILKVNSQIDIEGSVHCNETIKNYIWRGRGSEYWQIITNNIYDIQFQDCESNLDLVISIFDIHSQEDIVHTYCNNGDNCGHCEDTNKYHEHFTIPSVPPSTYIIRIKPFVIFRYGSYTFTINCYPAKNDTFVLNSATTIPPVSLQYNELKCGSINPIATIEEVPHKLYLIRVIHPFTPTSIYGPVSSTLPMMFNGVHDDSPPKEAFKARHYVVLYSH
eukprot:836249_1